MLSYVSEHDIEKHTGIEIDIVLLNKAHHKGCLMAGLAQVIIISMYKVTGVNICFFECIYICDQVWENWSKSHILYFKKSVSI